ncbi:MAG: NUDIX hydrolase [Candidatus Paceibacterota bacterium]
MKMNEHSTVFPDSFYRVTVKGLCVREGKILLFHESPALSGKWEIPGGGLDFGEDIKLGLKREIEEETGLTIKKISDKPFYVWTHRFENNERKLGWYYSLVLAYRIDFEDLNFTATDECEAIEFFSKEDLKTIELCGQTNELADIFDPKDFEELF